MWELGFSTEDQDYSDNKESSYLWRPRTYWRLFDGCCGVRDGGICEMYLPWQLHWEESNRTMSRSWFCKVLQTFLVFPVILGGVESRIPTSLTFNFGSSPSLFRSRCANQSRNLGLKFNYELYSGRCTCEEPFSSFERAKDGDQRIKHVDMERTHHRVCITRKITTSTSTFLTRLLTLT